MNDTVLIDYQIKGWALKNESLIRERYSEVRYVGDPPNPKANGSDSAMTRFCMDNNCDLLTSDKRAYAPLLEEWGAGEVRISLFNKKVQSGFHVYLVKYGGGSFPKCQSLPP